MFSSRILGLFAAFAAAVNAAPVIDQRDIPANFTDDGDRDLRNGEMMVYGLDGRTQIITEATWALYLDKEGIAHDTPEIDHDWIKAGDQFRHEHVNETEATLDKRATCKTSTQIVVDKSQRFVDWDVQMSPVVIGAGTNGIDATISKSYSIANGVTVSAGVDITIIKDYLKASLKIDYSTTWTTTQGYLIRGTIDDGYTGVVITRPWTNRKYGRTFQGCIGSLKQTGTFMADSHEPGSYEGVSWVAGAITLCSKKQRSIPLSRCNGGGYFS